MAMLMRLTESGLVTAVGVFMVVLSRSSLYWQFINPKYSWLTFAAGCVLTLVGFGCLFNRSRRAKPSEIFGLALFLGISVVAVGSLEPLMGGGLGASAAPTTLSGEAPAQVSPTLSVGGREYIKINVAELIRGADEGYVSAGTDYAIQGTLIRSPDLDAKGYVCVARRLIVCCFADSIGVMCLVKVDQPEAYEIGAWVRALGVLEEGAPPVKEPLDLDGTLTDIWGERYVLRAREVREHPVQGLPFVFEVRTEAPFSY